MKFAATELGYFHFIRVYFSFAKEGKKVEF